MKEYVDHILHHVTPLARFCLILNATMVLVYCGAFLWSFWHGEHYRAAFACLYAGALAWLFFSILKSPWSLKAPPRGPGGPA